MTDSTVQEYDIKFKFDSSVKKIEKLEAKLSKIRERQATNTEKVKNSVKRTALWMDRSADKSQAAAQAAFRNRVEMAKTADEVRNVVASERHRVRLQKQQTREMKKQSFLMNKMKASSQQLAGNMVSACNPFLV